MNDAASAASGAAIADATNAGTVNFSAGGVSDSFASLVTGGGAGTVSTNMAKIDAKDADVNVTVTDAPLADGCKRSDGYECAACGDDGYCDGDD